MIKSFLLIIGILISCMVAHAQAPSDVSSFWGKKEAIVVAKNYPFLYHCMTTPVWQRMIVQDKELAVFFQKKLQFLKQNSSKDFYKNSPYLLFDSMQFSETDILLFVQAFNRIERLSSAFGNSLAQWIQQSGAYTVDAKKSSNDLISLALHQDLQGINYTMDVYGKGKKPHYPNIDSMSIGKGEVGTIQQEIAPIIASETEKVPIFFYPALKVALWMLELNGRFDAADFEPMSKSVNTKALTKIKITDWNRYPYTHILLLGAGPEFKEDSLHPIGILRCKLAAIQYFKGLAPFIIPSGGRVHPYKTNYSEALEMKKYLVGELGVPESVIIMEPHARHTTTNVRNAVRLLIEYGIPLQKAGLICSTSDQLGWVVLPSFAERCEKEMGTVPFRLGKKLSHTLTEYFPLTAARKVDPTEPLDP